MPESIVGFLKSCKEFWPLLFASNFKSESYKQIRGIRIIQAIIIGLVLAGGDALVDSYKTEKTMMKEATVAIMESQKEGFKEIKIMIEKKDEKMNDRLDNYDIVLRDVIGRVGNLEGTIKQWEVNSGN